jgi:phage-related protein
MGNVLTDALAPVLTDIVNSFTGLVKGCIDSYNSGGTVATIFQVIVTVVKNLGVEIDAVAGIFKALWDAVVDIVGAIASDISDAFGVKTPNATQMAETSLNLFKDAWGILKDSVTIVILVIKGLIIGFIDELTRMGTIARDVFTLNWGAIQGDWQSGLARIQKHATETAAQIKAAYADLAKTVAAATKGQAVPGPAPAGGPSTSPMASTSPDLRAAVSASTPEAGRQRPI